MVSVMPSSGTYMVSEGPVQLSKFLIMPRVVLFGAFPQPYDWFFPGTTALGSVRIQLRKVSVPGEHRVTGC